MRRFATKLSPAQHRALIRAGTAAHSRWSGSTLATRESLVRRGMITNASSRHADLTLAGEAYVAGFLAALAQLQAPRKRGCLPTLMSACWRLEPVHVAVRLGSRRT